MLESLLSWFRRDYETPSVVSLRRSEDFPLRSPEPVRTHISPPPDPPYRVRGGRKIVRVYRLVTERQDGMVTRVDVYFLAVCDMCGERLSLVKKGTDFDFSTQMLDNHKCMIW